MSGQVCCPECGHPQRRHIPYRLPADLWRCNYGGCECVVRWSPTAEEERHHHVWVDGKCQTCAAREAGDVEAILAELRRSEAPHITPPESGSGLPQYDGTGGEGE